MTAHPNKAVNVYPPGIGQGRTKPFTRPAGDSLPRHDCPTPGCGSAEVLHISVAPTLYRLTLNPYSGELPEPSTYFCSLGCVSRWSTREELRS